MNYPLLIPVSLALGWMLSPESLVLQGNSAGSGGGLFFPAIAVAAVISAACIFLLHHPTIPDFPDEISTLSATLIVANRLSLVLLLPTGLLVTAGFAFNETFVYWFPNFGFSFLLLAFLLALHLIGEKPAAAMQPLFIGTSLICLLLLSIIGTVGHGGTPVIPAEPALPLFAHLSAGALVLFLGYDSIASGGLSSKQCRIYCWGAVAIGCLLFILWAMASLRNAGPAELADSTIPYSLAARKILGQPGRIVIGIAIISGTLGCVNALFILANRSMVLLTENFFLRMSGGTMLKNRIYPLVFSALIGSFMAAGMAGSGNLEIYIRGALILWLLTVGLRCLAATRILRVLGPPITVFGYILGAVFIFSTFYLIFSHPHNTQVLAFCGFTLAASTVVSKCLLHLNRQTMNQKPEQQ